MGNYNVDDILEEVKRKRARESGYPVEDHAPPYQGQQGPGSGYTRPPAPRQRDGYGDAYPREPYPSGHENSAPPDRGYPPPRQGYAPPPRGDYAREDYTASREDYAPPREDYTSPREDYTASREDYPSSREEYARFLASYGQARREAPRRQERYETYGGAARRPSYPSEKFDTYIGTNTAGRQKAAGGFRQTPAAQPGGYEYDPYSFEPEQRAPQPPPYRERVEPSARLREDYRPAVYEDRLREAPRRAPQPKDPYAEYGYPPPGQRAAYPAPPAYPAPSARNATPRAGVAPPMPPQPSPPPSVTRRTPRPSMDDLLENFGEGVGLGKGLEPGRKNGAARRVDIPAPAPYAPPDPPPSPPASTGFNFSFNPSPPPARAAYPQPSGYEAPQRPAPSSPGSGYGAPSGFDRPIGFDRPAAPAYPDGRPGGFGDAQEQAPPSFEAPAGYSPSPPAFSTPAQDFDAAATGFSMPSAGGFGAPAAGFDAATGYEPAPSRFDAAPPPEYGMDQKPFEPLPNGFQDAAYPAYGGAPPESGTVSIASEALPFDESELNGAATRMAEVKVADPMRTPPVGHIPLAPEDTQDDVDYDENGDIVHTVNSEEERQTILSAIRRAGVGLWVRLGLTAAAFFTLAYFALAYQDKDIATFEFMWAQDDTMRMFLIVNVAIVAVSMLVNSTTIGGGLVSLCTLKADNDSLISLAMIACVVQGVALIISPEAAVAPGTEGADVIIHLYFCVPVLGLVFNLLGKIIMMQRIRLNSRLACSQGEKYVMRTIKSEDFSRELSRGLPTETPEITYSVKAQYVSGFLNASYARDYAESLNQMLAFICLGAAAAVAVLAYFLNESATVYLSLTVFAGLLAISVPFTATLVGNLPMFRAALKLRRANAVISGYPVVEEYNNVKAVTFKAKDLFPEDSISLNGMKVFQESMIEQAILDAASVICATDSPLAGIFRGMINANDKILKPVDNIVYEDAMGLSAWVDGKRVLIGNAQLMRNHGIATPSRDYEQRYVGEGKDILYLSNSGELIALFALVYASDKQVSAQMRELAQGGVSLIIHTTDPNITAKRVAQLFNYPEHYAKVVSANLHADYERMTAPKTRARASIIYSGTVMSMFQALGIIPRIKSAVTVGTLCQMLAMLVGYGLFTFFAFFPSLGELSCWALLAYQLLSALVTAIAMNIRRI